MSGRGESITACSLILAGSGSLVILFEYVERVAVMVLHADSAKNGSHRARGASLLPDHFSHISGRNPEPEHRALVSFHRFDNDCLGSINQRACNLSH